MTTNRGYSDGNGVMTDIYGHLDIPIAEAHAEALAEIARAIYSVAHGDVHSPGGLEALAMSVAGEGLPRDGLAGRLAEAISDAADSQAEATQAVAEATQAVASAIDRLAGAAESIAKQLGVTS